MSSSKTLKITQVNTSIIKSKNIYDNTLEAIKEKVSLISIRPSTLYLIIKYVMEEVEKTPIKGPEQKEIALNLIKALIIDLTENEDEKVLLDLLNDGTIGNLIDLIVDVSKGKININKISKVSMGCFKRCYPYLCKSKKYKEEKKQQQELQEQDQEQEQQQI